MESQTTLDSQNNLEQKNTEKVIISNSKLYYRCMVIKATRYLDKNKHVDQLNKKEDQT